MRKKVYKKNKKVVETVIFEHASKKKYLNLSRLFFFIGAFFIGTFFYYLSISFVTNITLSSITGFEHIPQNFSSSNKKVLPAPIAVQSLLLQKKKQTSVSLQNPSWLTENITAQPDHIIWHGPRDKKEIALTFDADMTPVMVDWLHSGQVQTYDDTRITDFLTQNQIKATFFLTGLWIESYPNATKALADNALFELENHTYSHPSMAGYCYGQPQIPVSQYPFEIEKTQQLIEQYTHKEPKYFRFSGGCYDQYDLDLVKKEGLITVHWDDVGNDGFNPNENEIINNVLSEAQNGSIIVLHMGGQTNIPATPDALPVIVDGLKKRGFQFVTVSELLNPPVLAAKLDPKQYLSSLESFSNLTP